MSSTTAHFGLTKAASNERYSLPVVNGNSDIIDTQMYNNQQSAAKLMVGATSSADGESGRVPAPLIADKDKYLKGDGTWDTPSGGVDMTGATASTAGTHGLVPAPSVGDNEKFLRGDGTWQTASGGGGSSTLAGLTDVNLSSPTDGQALVYDATNQEWVNGTVSGGGSSEVKYSTTEHKVGTWIDGSDVYEQTIILRENGTNNYTYIDSVFSQCLPANIDWIDIVSFYSKRNVGGYVDCMNNSSETNIVPNPSNQSIYYQTMHNASDVIVTIRYTKTGGNS